MRTFIRVRYLSMIKPARRAVLAAVLCLGACGGTERSASTEASPEPSASSGQVAPATAAASPFGITTYAASRFLEQATFGPTASSIAELKRLGFEGWIASQQALPVPAIDGSILEGRDPGPPDPLAVEFAPARFTRIAISDPAQLRVRAAWSLSQFLVVSQNKVVAFAVVQYANFLMANAFTNYADFLRALTLHASMGNFLDNSENRAASACIGCSPNENYARELLQLFTIGVHKLNIDGSIVRDVRGRPVETYAEADVQALARALTGWTFQSAEPGLGKGNWANFGKPMIALRPNDHDKDAKRLLGTDMSPNQNASSDLDAAIAIIMAHPNVAPFVSLRLIQHLVASDPSPDYIRRVATVFNNDGAGRKGNLAAVVKAVLLDDEARSPDGLTDPGFGKLREPLLRLVQWARAFKASSLSGDWNFGNLSDPSTRLGQSPQRSPSVFNYFRPGYVPAGTAIAGAGLVAPEFQLANETSVAGYLNFMLGVCAARHADIRPDYSAERTLASDAAALVARIERLLCADQLGSGARQLIVDAIQGLPKASSTDLDNRVATAAYLVLAAPDYLVQR